jgi:DnaJ-class molecular chaperone
MANEKGPNVKKKQKCKNYEGKGLVKKGDKVVKCQRCRGTAGAVSGPYALASRTI